MRSSVGKLTVALGERGKGKEAREVFEAHGFDPDTTDLELGRRVYTALRGLLKEIGQT
ncbi:hypothetical protein BH24DEI2_BH24DEI2_12940 [soil metagenome]